MKFPTILFVLCTLALPSFAQHRIQFERIGYEEGLSHLSVNSIFQDSSGFIWFATTDGLCRYDGFSCKVFKHDDADSASLPYNEISDFVKLPDGGFGVESSSSHGIARFEALTETFSPVKDSTLFHSKGIWKLYVSPFFIGDMDSVWRFSYHNRSIVRRLPDGSTKQYLNLFPKTDGIRFYALLLHDGKLWFATTVGLFVFDAERETMALYQRDPDNPASIPENSVRHLYVDREQNLWVATYGGGVARVSRKRNPFQTFSHAPNASNSVVGGLLFGISEARDGTLWIVSENNGISEFRRREGKFISHLFDPNNPNSPQTNRYHTCFCDSDGKLWANGSVFDPRKRQWHRLPIDPIPDPWGERGYLEVGDTVYFFAVNRLYAVHRNTLKAQMSTLPLLRSIDEVRHCYRDRDGRLFIGTFNGFAELDLPTRTLDNWRLVNPNQTDSNFTVVQYGHVQCIYQTKDGRYWVGTRGGGLFIFGKKFETVENLATRNGFPDNVIYDILEDDDGMLWMTTNKGLVKFNPSQKKCERLFTTADGLPNDEFNQYCFAKLRTGEFVGGGVGGFSIFNPKELDAKRPSLSVALTDFKLFEESQSLDTSILFKKSISLDYHQNFFSFAFASPSYANPKAIEYAYKLEGIDGDWIETRSNVARYNSISHGDYAFRVKARLHNGEWGAERVVYLRISPPFWKTGWFVVGSSLVLLTLAVFGVRAFIAQRVRAEVEEVKRQEELKRAKEIAILAERERIAADVHDDIGAALTNITMIAEQLKQHPQRSSTDALNMLALTAREATQGIRAIVWSMNPQYDSLDAFAAYLREKTHQQLDATPIELTIDFPDALPPIEISGEMRHNLFLAVREALNNVLKHSHATHAHLSMTLDGKSLTLVVQDNGVGIERNETSGNGALFMQRRLNQIGGECWITSEKGNGTQVRFQVDLKKNNENGTI